MGGGLTLDPSFRFRGLAILCQYQNALMLSYFWNIRLISKRVVV